jgi:hypothetical protein
MGGGKKRKEEGRKGGKGGEKERERVTETERGVRRKMHKEQEVEERKGWGPGCSPG